MDDLLDTGKTLATTVELLKAEGADNVYGFATHARWVSLLCVGGWFLFMYMCVSLCVSGLDVFLLFADNVYGFATHARWVGLLWGGLWGWMDGWMGSFVGVDGWVVWVDGWAGGFSLCTCVSSVCMDEWMGGFSLCTCVSLFCGRGAVWCCAEGGTGHTHPSTPASTRTNQHTTHPIIPSCHLSLALSFSGVTNQHTTHHSIIP